MGIYLHLLSPKKTKAGVSGLHSERLRVITENFPENETISLFLFFLVCVRVLPFQIFFIQISVFQ